MNRSTSNTKSRPRNAASGSKHSQRRSGGESSNGRSASSESETTRSSNSKSASSRKSGGEETNGKSKSQGKSSVSGNGQSRSSASSGRSAGQQSSKTLQDLLIDGLMDIYSAETQLLEALPEMSKAAYDEDLSDAFNHHLEETKRQVERLEKVFSRFGISGGEGKTCEAMEGLIAEGQEIISEYEESPVRDAALIIAAQKVEHYEIASYGSLCELCDVLGFHRIGDILGRSLNEEEETDEKLSEIAKQVNDDACEMSEHESGTFEYSGN